jgi:phosphoribosylamine---glycine ligase
MNFLVIGSGGREHALTWKLRESQLSEDLYCAPGNPGVAQEAECLRVDAGNPQALLEAARDLKAGLTVVGPEAPLVAGVVDEFERAGLAIIGPHRAAAMLEGSKIFAKQFMQRHAIPTARFAVAEDFESALKSLKDFQAPVVIKADGLAAGKGVVVAHSLEEAEQTLDDFMRRRSLGASGERVVLEECLAGEEMSFIVLTDGSGVVPLTPTQDHKAVFDGDQGPNTGGMGAYSDDSILSERQSAEIMHRIVLPTVAGMAAEGIPYRGFLYCGLMLTAEGPKVLEYNVRLGDPETQPTLMRLRSDLGELLVALRERRLAGLQAHWSPNPAVCVVLASAGYPGKPETGKIIEGVKAAESLAGVKVFHAGTEFRDLNLYNSGGRVLGVTATAESLPATLERVYAAVGKIQFEGMHYRHDIGAKGIRRPARGAKEKPAAPRGRRLSGPARS